MTLAAGEHVRLPRSYRGRDIFWWLEATGLLAERYDEIDDLTRARHLPSPQLTGTSRAAMKVSPAVNRMKPGSHLVRAR